ncbi:hypothetical protein K440DRAFT_662555 [Wilcoxina mikolae CBS 423.85]|nr:hypothetical protein K440DRAFT_662555 [Wilcoxina mikolae CBS 423.85]
MASTALLSIPRGDVDGNVLVHVTSNSSTQLLDLTIQATEGEYTFQTKLKESELSLYKHRQFTGSNDELRSIILHLFLRTPATDAELVEGLELSALAEDDIVTIRIGKRYGRVKQQIASFGIAKEVFEIEMFPWAVESCMALDTVNKQLQKHQSEAQEKDKMIENLTAQLKALTALKKEHEELLLVKFKELLNAKKAKIRELDRALESASAAQDAEEAPRRDSGKGKAVVESPEPKPEPEPAPTRGRRKAAPKAAPKAAAPSRKRKPAPPPSDSDSDDFAAAKMDVDEPPKRTTRTTRAGSKVPEKVAAKPPPVENDDTATASEDEPQSDRKDSEDEDELPPVRKPIEFKSSKPAPPPAKAIVEPADGGDTTDDDEL